MAPVKRAEQLRRQGLKYQTVDHAPPCAATSYELFDANDAAVRLLHVHCDDVLFATGKATLGASPDAQNIAKRLTAFFTKLGAGDKVLVLGSVDRERFDNKTQIPLPADDLRHPDAPTQDDEDDWRRNRQLSMMRAEYVRSLVPANIRSYAIGLGETFVAACEEAGECDKNVAKQPKARRIDVFVLQALAPKDERVVCQLRDPLACLEDAAATSTLVLPRPRTKRAPVRFSCWLGDDGIAVTEASALVAFALELLGLEQEGCLCHPEWKTCP